MTLPVPRAVADASLDAAILVYLARHPGAKRSDIECSHAVADILCRAPNVSRATEWLHERLQGLHKSGAIERRHRCVGWFAVERAA